jgi:hypothetical protein
MLYNGHIIKRTLKNALERSWNACSRLRSLKDALETQGSQRSKAR